MSAALSTARADPVVAVRRFSRFYTRQLGLLDEGLLNSTFSLTEARVLYELANRQTVTATELCRDLGIDPGYLSRILKNFEQRGLITRSVAPGDARQSLLQLTASGREAFEPLDRASRQQVLAMIGPRTPAETLRLTHAMRTVEELLGEQTASPVILRRHCLGDVGWIAHRQAILYAQEYDWDGTYEVLAAEILASIVKNFDPAWDQSWIAERDGAVIGSVFVVRGSDMVAKLRLLYVEPVARGLGLGRRLVDACISFARDKGYRTLTLWTNDVLVPARRIYQEAGFTCVGREPHHSFGQDLVGETWELAL
ncbi:MAG TPA: helix-turn-helix domain-containing GNAT family N-acetyltransferase [Rhodopila sp.]|jgi:DNA-binding MarR family transcriptional regulator/N-acetylglutamate synthase-like GNAT family acetyltransferase